MGTIEEQNKIIYYKKLWQNGDINIVDLHGDIQKRIRESIDEEQTQNRRG